MVVVGVVDIPAAGAAKSGPELWQPARVTAMMPAIGQQQPPSAAARGLQHALGIDQCVDAGAATGRDPRAHALKGGREGLC